jgi:hypothetical protein
MNNKTSHGAICKSYLSNDIKSDELFSLLYCGHLFRSLEKKADLVAGERKHKIMDIVSIERERERERELFHVLRQYCFIQDNSWIMPWQILCKEKK